MLAVRRERAASRREASFALLRASSRGRPLGVACGGCVGCLDPRTISRCPPAAHGGRHVERGTVCPLPQDAALRPPPRGDSGVSHRRLVDAPRVVASDAWPPTPAVRGLARCADAGNRPPPVLGTVPRLPSSSPKPSSRVRKLPLLAVGYTAPNIARGYRFSTYWTFWRQASNCDGNHTRACRGAVDRSPPVRRTAAQPSGRSASQPSRSRRSRATPSSASSAPVLVTPRQRRSNGRVSGGSIGTNTEPASCAAKAVRT